MVEEKLDYDVFSQMEKPGSLKKAVVIIMLDYTHPESFMEELDGWINFLYEMQKRAGFTMSDLEEMGALSNHSLTQSQTTTKSIRSLSLMKMGRLGNFTFTKEVLWRIHHRSGTSRHPVARRSPHQQHPNAADHLCQ
jgi:hypothetical protein